MEEEYVYLDFNGKLSSDVFNNKVFFRAANLHKPEPLVQVNDMVFKGKFDHSMGTNMFFQKFDVIPPSTSSPFDSVSPLELRHLVNQTKVINLKQMRVPPRKMDMPEGHQEINYNWEWDYNELLKKFEQGTLGIEDIVKSDESITQNEGIGLSSAAEEENIDREDMEIDSIVQNENNLSSDELERLERLLPHKILYSKYQKLQMLARQPAKRQKSPETVVECDPSLQQEFEYKNMERQILQPSYNHVLTNPKEINEQTLSDCVNIDRCVLYGLLPPSDETPRILIKEEKKAVLTMENFDNLSLPARHYVLKNQLECLEIHVSGMSQKQLRTKDNFGRTPVETLEIYRKLLRAVEIRLQEISSSLKSDE